MRFLNILLLCGLLAACSSTKQGKTSSVSAPSVGRVKSSLVSSQDFVGRATTSSSKIQLSIIKSKGYSTEIEQRAAEILKDWK
jgi:hypothetical protein